MDATTSPIRLGSILFTLVEPRKGHEVEYNRWYERDHFYAGCLIGPYLFSGARWVATAACKRRRYPEDSTVTGGDPARGSYLALYWVLDGHHDEWNRWAVRQVKALHGAQRMFPERDHVHTLLYRYEWGSFRDEDGVPPELALDHRFPGLAVLVGETSAGTTREELFRWYREEHLPNALRRSSSAMCLTFTPIPLRWDAPSDVPRSTDDEVRFLQLYFLDRDPNAAWEEEFARHGEEVEKSGLGRIVFASPFLPTVPGTDRYTDELW